MPLPDNLFAPISAEKPCGEPAALAPWYDKLRELRRPNEAALESFLGQQSERKPRIMTRDIWAPREPRKLFELLCDALATKSKDLELAAWLTESLAWRDGLAGLNEGLGLLCRFLTDYWDHLHPLPDEDGDLGMRCRYLEWVGMTDNVKDSCVILVIGFIPVTQSGLSLNQYAESRAIPSKDESGDKARDARREAQAVGKIFPEDFDAALAATPKAFYKQLKAAAAAARDTLAALEKLCTQKFPSDPPGFTKLKDRLEKAENTADILLRKKLEQDPDPVEAAPVEPAAVAAAAEAEDSAPASAAAASSLEQLLDSAGAVNGMEPGSKQEAFVRIAAVARYLRKIDPANPVPYLLVRSLRWGELYGAGEKIAENLLAAPPTQVRSQLKSFATAGQWAQVLELAESAMATEYGRGWLDLQRYSVKACEALGYHHVARTILCAVRHLLADYPKLPKSTLEDDTGAANPETMQWLAENSG